MHTTIRIDPETRDELKVLGRKGDSYDDIIKTILRAYHEQMD